jgi:hypothetical protein
MLCQVLERFQEVHGVKFKKVTQIALEGDGLLRAKSTSAFPISFNLPSLNYQILGPALAKRESMNWGERWNRGHRADILLDKGIIKGIGHVACQLASQFTEHLVTVDVNGSWVTLGIVDMQSHLGDFSSPELEGSSDGNSVKDPVVPWMA